MSFLVIIFFLLNCITEKKFYSAAFIEEQKYLISDRIQKQKIKVTIEYIKLINFNFLKT